ncbi:Serine/threonine-protein kinase ATM [Ananas comosus]|uniref:Serine/threonine-protein kinase ATM n=1 Tax=Ananas comosus TaxID=4615 RepID=A0A199UVG2_ANACO|nr:Serine/threonine-protein kinase ATM [Ananas comosus]
MEAELALDPGGDASGGGESVERGGEEIDGGVIVMPDVDRKQEMRGGEEESVDHQGNSGGIEGLGSGNGAEVLREGVEGSSDKEASSKSQDADTTAAVDAEEMDGVEDVGKDQVLDVGEGRGHVEEDEPHREDGPSTADDAIEGNSAEGHAQDLECTVDVQNMGGKGEQVVHQGGERDRMQDVGNDHVEVSEGGNGSERKEEDQSCQEDKPTTSNDVVEGGLMEKHARDSDGNLGVQNLGQIGARELDRVRDIAEDHADPSQVVDVSVPMDEDEARQEDRSFAAKNQSTDDKVMEQAGPLQDAEGPQEWEEHKETSNDEKVKNDSLIAYGGVEAERLEGLADEAGVQVAVAEINTEGNLISEGTSFTGNENSMEIEAMDQNLVEGHLIATETLDEAQLKAAETHDATIALGEAEAGGSEGMCSLREVGDGIPDKSNDTVFAKDGGSFALRDGRMENEVISHDTTGGHFQTSEGSGGSSKNQSIVVESTSTTQGMVEDKILEINQENQTTVMTGESEHYGSIPSNDQNRDDKASVSGSSMVDKDQSDLKADLSNNGKEVENVASLPADVNIVDQFSQARKDSANPLAECANLHQKTVNKNLSEVTDIPLSSEQSRDMDGSKDEPVVSQPIIATEEVSDREAMDIDEQSTNSHLLVGTVRDKVASVTADEHSDVKEDTIVTVSFLAGGSEKGNSETEVSNVAGGNSETEASNVAGQINALKTGLSEVETVVLEKECGELPVGETQESKNHECSVADQISCINPIEVEPQLFNEDKTQVLGLHDVDFSQKSEGGQGEDNQHLERTEEQTEKSAISSTDSSQHAKYYLPPVDRDAFAVSDLIWGKVKSHPWWPGQIFDPSYASELALKYQKKDTFLVAYFGDKTFAWCDEFQLKPLHTNFSQMEKQSTSDAFRNSINSALEEVSRRVELGMACFCLPEEFYAGSKYQKVENAGIRGGIYNCVIDKSSIMSYFQPDRLLDYVKSLSQIPDQGADELELVIAKAQLKAFYQSKGYPELPTFLIGGPLVENDTEPELVEATIDGSSPALTDMESVKPKRGRGRPPKKQKNIVSELMEEKNAISHVNGGKIESGSAVDDELASLSSGKKRKQIDFDYVDPEKHKAKKVDLLEDMETKSASPTFGSSFKVGEFIRRAASHLTGAPPILKLHGETIQKSVTKVDDGKFDVFSTDDSTHPVVERRKRKLSNSKDYASPEELLSQLCLAASDPTEEYDFSPTIICFFTDFRDFTCTVSSEDEKHAQKAGGKRGRKRKVDSQLAISESSVTDHMQDSYWSDLINDSSPLIALKRRDEAHLQRRRRRKSLGETSPSLSHLQAGNVSPSLKQVLATDRSVVTVEEKIVDECTPTALFLSFSKSNALPSETDLIRIFSRYGPLREAETEVQMKLNRAKVIFKRRADAEIAFSSAGKYSIFGPSLISYRLRHLPLSPDISPSMTLQGENSAILGDVDNLEVPAPEETRVVSETVQLEAVGEGSVEKLTEMNAQTSSNFVLALEDTVVESDAMQLEAVDEGLVEKYVEMNQQTSSNSVIALQETGVDSDTMQIETVTEESMGKSTELNEQISSDFVLPVEETGIESDTMHFEAVGQGLAEKSSEMNEQTSNLALEETRVESDTPQLETVGEGLVEKSIEMEGNSILVLEETRLGSDAMQLEAVGDGLVETSAETGEETSSNFVLTLEESRVDADAMHLEAVAGGSVEKSAEKNEQPSSDVVNETKFELDTMQIEEAVAEGLAEKFSEMKEQASILAPEETRVDSDAMQLEALAEGSVEKPTEMNKQTSSDLVLTLEETKVQTSSDLVLTLEETKVESDTMQLAGAIGEGSTEKSSGVNEQTSIFVEESKVGSDTVQLEAGGEESVENSAEMKEHSVLAVVETRVEPDSLQLEAAGEGLVEKSGELNEQKSSDFVLAMGETRVDSDMLIEAVAEGPADKSIEAKQQTSPNIPSTLEETTIGSDTIQHEAVDEESIEAKQQTSSNIPSTLDKTTIESDSMQHEAVDEITIESDMQHETVDEESIEAKQQTSFNIPSTLEETTTESGTMQCEAVDEGPDGKSIEMNEKTSSDFLSAVEETKVESDSMQTEAFVEGLVGKSIEVNERPSTVAPEETRDEPETLQAEAVGGGLVDKSVEMNEQTS